jgi:hypothetical protein
VNTELQLRVIDALTKAAEACTDEALVHAKGGDDKLATECDEQAARLEKLAKTVRTKGIMLMGDEDVVEALRDLMDVCGEIGSSFNDLLERARTLHEET